MDENRKSASAIVIGIKKPTTVVGQDGGHFFFSKMEGRHAFWGLEKSQIFLILYFTSGQVSHKKNNYFCESTLSLFNDQTTQIPFFS